MKRALPAIALLLGVLFAFSDVLGPDRMLFFRDHGEVFRPRWMAVADSFAHGELPVLTNVTRGGVPFERNLNATYTPLAPIVLFGDIEVTYDLLVIAHFVLLAAGIFVLARALGATRAQAFGAAAVGTLSGPMVSWESLFIAVQALSYAPWVYWALLRVLQRPSLARVAIAALAIGCHLQGIMPELVLLDAIAFVLLVVHVRPRFDVRLAGALALAGVLGVALASIVLMPVIENLAYTARGAGFDYAESSRWSLHPLALIELAVPAFWAPPEIPFAYAAPILEGETSALMSSLYLGPAMAIAFCAFADRAQRRWAIAFLALSLAALAIAMGHHLPFHRWLVHLPLLKSARFPVKYTALALAFFVPLVVLGLRAIASRPRWFLATSAIQAIVVAVLASIVFGDALASWAVENMPDPIPLAVQGIDRAGFGALFVASMHAHALHALVFSVMAAALALVIVRKPSPIATACIAALLLVDLASAARLVVFGAPRLPKGPKPEIVEQLRDPFHRLARVSPNREEHPIRFDPKMTIAESQFVSMRQRGMFLFGELRLLDDRNDDAASNPRSALALRLLNGLHQEEALRLFARAGVSWISTPIQRTGEDLAGEVEGEAPQYFSRVPDVRPAVKSFARWRVADLEHLDRGALQRLYTAPDAIEVAVLPSGPAATSTDTASCEAGAQTIMKPESRFGDVIVEHRAPCPMLVSVLHTAMHGWRVTVDDREVEPLELLEVDFGWLATEVPPGEHTIRFQYCSSASRWAYVSLAALILCALLVLTTFRSPNRASAAA